MQHVMHHRHVRKRMYENLEQFPHPDFFKRMFDRLIYVVGFLGPIFVIPQIYLIYANHNATGVSALSWTVFALFDTVWISYGLLHKERILVFAYTLWLIANTTVAIGAVLYGGV